MVGFYRDYYSFENRATRLEFLFANIATSVMSFLLFFVMMFLTGLVFGVNLLSPSMWNPQNIKGALMSGNMMFSPKMIYLLLIAYLVAYVIMVFWPTLATAVRRLHDHNLSGWYLLVPVAAWLIVYGVAQWGYSHYGKTDPAALSVGRTCWIISQIINLICLFVFLLKRGTVGPNRFGGDASQARDYMKQRMREKRAEYKLK